MRQTGKVSPLSSSTSQTAGRAAACSLCLWEGLGEAVDRVRGRGHRGPRGHADRRPNLNAGTAAQSSREACSGRSILVGLLRAEVRPVRELGWLRVTRMLSRW